MTLTTPSFNACCRPTGRITFSSICSKIVNQLNIACAPDQMLKNSFKQVYRRRYESRRSSKRKLYFKKKYCKKTIFNMADGIITPCNVACGSGIMTVNSPSGSNLQCGRCLSDDMLWNSPKRSPYWNSTSVSILTISPQSICHSVPVCEIISKSYHPQHKKWRHVDFQDGGSQPSWILRIQ